MSATYLHKSSASSMRAYETHRDQARTEHEHDHHDSRYFEGIQRRSELTSISVNDLEHI